MTKPTSRAGLCESKIKIKNSLIKCVPNSLDVGEFSIGFSNSDYCLSIGTPTNISPINSLNVYTTTTNFTIPKFNSFTTGTGLISINLPKTSLFNIGQTCVIKNIGLVSLLTINPAAGDTINGITSITISPDTVARFISTTVGSIQTI